MRIIYESELMLFTQNYRN